MAGLTDGGIAWWVGSNDERNEEGTEEEHAFFSIEKHPRQHVIFSVQQAPTPPGEKDEQRNTKK